VARNACSHPSEICRTSQIHTQALAQAECSRLSEASRSSKRGSPKRERVRTLARRCSFQPRQGTLFLSEGTTRSSEEGLALARIRIPTTLTVGRLAQARTYRLS